jgi:hypothetical protein
MSDADENPMPLLNCDRCASTLAQDQIGLCGDCQEEMPKAMTLQVQLAPKGQPGDTNVVGLELSVVEDYLGNLLVLREQCRMRGANAETRLAISPAWLARGGQGVLLEPELVVDIGGVRFEAKANGGAQYTSPWVNLGVLLEAMSTGMETVMVSDDKDNPLSFLEAADVDIDISSEALVISPAGVYPVQPRMQPERPRAGS